MSWKNQLLIKISKWLAPPRNENKDPEQPRILVLSTTGLGDSLWGTPAIRAVKTSYPNAYLAVLTSPIGAELFRNNPYIDQTFTVQDPALPSCFKLLKTLQNEKFEIALVFHISQRPILPFITLCSPSKIIGTKGINKGLDQLLTHTLKTKKQHEIERRLDIASTIGASSSGAEMEIFLTDDERKSAKNFLKENVGENTFLVGIHPGAKDAFKKWHYRHFIALGKRLQKEKNAKVFITGNEAESTMAHLIADEIPGALSIAGRFPVRQTAALIENFHLFLTNDTGPMHIALAMKTPTFAPFAPTDAQLCGPYKTSNAAWIQKKPTCFPCIRKECQVPFCLEQISEEEAWLQISNLIQ